MPIYEYQCEKCGNKFEIIQKMSDKPLKKHERCGGKLDKLISASGFQFKGTGWYVTDYARKSSGEASDSSSKDSSESKDSKNGSTSAAKDTSSNGSSEKTEKPASSSKKEAKSTKE